MIEERVGATIDEIGDAIRMRLSTIHDLRVYAHEPEKPNFPCAYPRLVDWTFDDSFSGTTTWHFDVWVLVGLAPGLIGAQTWLNPYLSATGRNSIKCAIDDDPSLNGCVSFARVTGGGAYGRVDIAGVTALGASMRLEILA